MVATADEAAVFSVGYVAGTVQWRPGLASPCGLGVATLCWAMRSVEHERSRTVRVSSDLQLWHLWERSSVVQAGLPGIMPLRAAGAVT